LTSVNLSQQKVNYRQRADPQIPMENFGRTAFGCAASFLSGAGGRQFFTAIFASTALELSFAIAALI
jgi:hypothetical protein